MSDTCDVCLREVDDGLTCGECIDTDSYVELGQKKERNAIVAWLRLTARTLRATRASEAYGFGLAADRIEAGEHMKEKT